MAFGAFAPLPLRLGGPSTEGWSPEQHARVACDVAAMYSVKPFAILTYTLLAGIVTVTAYNGRNGVGVTFAPTPVVNGTGDVTWTWPASWVDDVGMRHTIAFSHARGGPHGTPGFVSTIAAGRVCEVVTTDPATDAAADMAVTLVIYSPEARRIAHYGGSLTKRASTTEGRIPHAWGWYRHYQAATGSAYTKSATGLVHCENLADARRQAAKTRAAEKVVRNSTPTTADERLAYWATVMRVPFSSGDLAQDVLDAVTAKAQLVAVVNRQALDEALGTLLGSAFVQTLVLEGSDLDNPPDETFWPVVNPGDPFLDLDGDAGGTWSSSRCRLVVEVAEDTPPPAAPSLAFLRLVNGPLLALLDDALPSYATFNFARIDHTNGFRCEISEVDIDGML